MAREWCYKYTQTLGGDKVPHPCISRIDGAESLFWTFFSIYIFDDFTHIREDWYRRLAVSLSVCLSHTFARLHRVAEFCDLLFFPYYNFIVENKIPQLFSVVSVNIWNLWPSPTIIYLCKQSCCHFLHTGDRLSHRGSQHRCVSSFQLGRTTGPCSSFNCRQRHMTLDSLFFPARRNVWLDSFCDSYLLTRDSNLLLRNTKVKTWVRE